jgi:signal transduction histidine kinase
MSKNAQLNHLATTLPADTPLGTALFEHELRGFFQTMSAHAAIQLLPDLNAAQRLDHARIIRAETLQMASLMDDLKTLRDLDADRLPLRLAETNLAEVIQASADAVRAEALERRIALGNRCHRPLWAEVDACWIHHILLNLLRNGIKYNRDGGMLSITASQSPAAQMLCIEIRDTGLGIAPEYLPHLFEAYYRVPDSAGFTEGTGLGLYLTQRLVEAHGGHISVYSELGVGTTFWLTLPVRQPDPARVLAPAVVVCS